MGFPWGFALVPRRDSAARLVAGLVGSAVGSAAAASKGWKGPKEAQGPRRKPLRARRPGPTTSRMPRSPLQGGQARRHRRPRPSKPRGRVFASCAQARGRRAKLSRLRRPDGSAKLADGTRSPRLRRSYRSNPIAPTLPERLRQDARRPAKAPPPPCVGASPGSPGRPLRTGTGSAVPREPHGCTGAWGRTKEVVRPCPTQSMRHAYSVSVTKQPKGVESPPQCDLLPGSRGSLRSQPVVEVAAMARPAQNAARPSAKRATQSRCAFRCGTRASAQRPASGEQPPPARAPAGRNAGQTLSKPTPPTT